MSIKGFERSFKITGGVFSIPVREKRFWLQEIKCAEKINCTDEDYKPICCSNSKTYDNDCELRVENQKKYCTLSGDFSPLVMVHPGHCKDRSDTSDTPNDRSFFLDR
ncbi:hypothetical protein MAR_009999 [Mya arenaria]|uniref:Kazal-like domain-containing protein n=1 Tax=Mya arenaria TaxID=6604 RepID=A0ABY7E4E3_MYAAR|nr:hypothetical protein MAR_009949 [Mya arenaria]WAR03441.1 hypothetical protein MAR_009999 [Mya arenaria]